MDQSIPMPPGPRQHDMSWIKTLLPLVIVGVCGVAGYFLWGHLHRAEYGNALGFFVLGFFAFFAVLYASATRQIESLDEKSLVFSSQIDARLQESKALREYGDKLAAQIEDQDENKKPASDMLRKDT